MFEPAEFIQQLAQLWQSQARLILAIAPPVVTLTAILLMESHRHLKARREQRRVDRALRRHLARCNGGLWLPVGRRTRHAA